MLQDAKWIIDHLPFMFLSDKNPNERHCRDCYVWNTQTHRVKTLPTTDTIAAGKYFSQFSHKK